MISFAQSGKVYGRVSHRLIFLMLVFAVCLIVLLRTMAPTVYKLDSAELSAGAATLGIVHAPGYPLYVMVAHLFTLLPIGDVGFRVNLFSAVCLALTAPIVFDLIRELIADSWVALTATLMLMWSYYIWDTGVAAEVYAPQLLTLSICGWTLVRMFRQRRTDLKAVLSVGLSYGIAVSMAPTSILFAPGLVVVFRLLRVRWRLSIYAGIAAFLIFVGPLSYFPARFNANPQPNLGGEYKSDGTFASVDLRTVQGIWWMIRGEQFDSRFFADGFFPTTNEIYNALSWFWMNFLGIGVVVGFIGLMLLCLTQRKLFVAWLVFFIPYTYFFITYDVVDRDTMFGPSYLLWAVVIAYGLRWLTRSMSTSTRLSVLLTAPIFIFIVNLPLHDLSNDTSIRQHGEALMSSLPNNAIVFGTWPDTAPMQYLTLVEKQRPDLQIYDLFLFNSADLAQYTQKLVAGSQRPVVFLGDTAQIHLDQTNYELTPIWMNSAAADSLVIGGFQVRERLKGDGTPAQYEPTGAGQDVYQQR